MKDHIFRLYDIRGKVPEELQTEQVAALTKAIAYYFKSQNPTVQRVAVGADGRIHSPEIKERVCAALLESGIDVVFVGVCPSPVLYFSLFNLPVDAGIMITASHNGPAYNGMKLCLGTESVWGDQIQEIKKLYQAGAQLQATATGSYQEQPVISLYVEWMVQQFPHLIGMPIKAVIDCGNGAGGTVLPQLLQAMQWPNVHLLYAEVDGTYPHHEADPIVAANMADVKKMLHATDIELGIGLDGDCDRMVAMTKTGELVQGDKLLAVFAQEILTHNPGATIVFDIKCSGGLPELLHEWGARPFISPSGHSIIKTNMKNQEALLAGELSCHFFFKDRYFGYDDALYAILRLFELVQSGKSLEQLLAVFPQKVSTPEFRIECEQDKMDGIVAAVHTTFSQRPDLQLMTIDGIRVSMGNGWGLLRASNTQPVLCLRFEADTRAHLDTIQQEFITALIPYYTKTFLQKVFEGSVE